MKIQYLSDLHLEFYRPEIIPHFLARIPQEGDVCVLAGDIGYPFQSSYELFLKGMHEKFEHVFLILGNHEFYQLRENKGKSVTEVIEHVQKIISENGLSHIHFLHNSHYDLGEYRFIGSILWSEIQDPRYLSNDYDTVYAFGIDEMNAMHHESRAYVDDAIQEAETEGKRAVLITHYLPSFKLNHPKYAQQYKYHQCFSSHSDDLIRSPPVVAWIFGHTHTVIQEEIAGVPCVANPFGYPRENNQISFDKILEIS